MCLAVELLLSHIAASCATPTPPVGPRPNPLSLLALSRRQGVGIHAAVAHGNKLRWPARIQPGGSGPGRACRGARGIACVLPAIPNSVLVNRSGNLVSLMPLHRKLSTLTLPGLHQRIAPNLPNLLNCCAHGATSEKPIPHQHTIAAVVILFRCCNSPTRAAISVRADSSGTAAAAGQKAAGVEVVAGAVVPALASRVVSFMNWLCIWRSLLPILRICISNCIKLLHVLTIHSNTCYVI